MLRKEEYTLPRQLEQKPSFRMQISVIPKTRLFWGYESYFSAGNPVSIFYAVSKGQDYFKFIFINIVYLLEILILFKFSLLNKCKSQIENKCGCLYNSNLSSSKDILVWKMHIYCREYKGSAEGSGRSVAIIIVGNGFCDPSSKLFEFPRAVIPLKKL